MSLAWRIALSALHRPERLRYGPDPSQVADLHLRAGVGRRPVAVVLHGGYWQPRYGKLIMQPLCIDLARRGWAAWNVEYRRLGPQGGGWPATFDDVAAGIDHLATLADRRLDLSRVVAIGHSAGGQLALWAAGRSALPPGAPGAVPRVELGSVVAMAAVTDMVKAGKPARALLGGSIDEVPDHYRQADPVRRIPLGVPVLLVHPTLDETVPVERSREYAAAARAAGDDVEFVEIASGGHREAIDPTGAAWATVVRWLER